MPSDRFDYSEDLFADTRMSFGEHIEDLRTHLIRAIKGLVLIVTMGFILDAVGASLGWDWLGIGRPMMAVITAPVREQLVAFYDRRLEKLEQDAKDNKTVAVEATKPKPFKLGFTPAQRAAFLGQKPPADAGDEIEYFEAYLSPLELYKANRTVNNFVRPPELTALSVQESMVVYFKVSFISGFVLASPWVFWQMWSFVAAGLYPHEKRLVHYWLPISLGLFLGGVFLCQFAVLPRSIEALLWFNEWLGIAPDLRLNEWLSFAIWLPVIFGVAFQTPLVMMVLERIGIMTVEKYLSLWRIAVFVLAVFAAIITPTTDFVTWFALWFPMVGLYFLGIYLCRMAARRRPAEFDVPESESDELVEV
ncbi:MAG TPA: twin-arginine translocase subunit TatC [Gemmataceae bacterium]|jgi:sec-independent protein translocase protein TatC